MGKAWNSGTKKPDSQKQIIFKGFRDGCFYHYIMVNGVQSEVARSWAEHEVCSGNARYVEVR